MNKNDYKLLMILDKDECNSSVKSKTAARIATEANLCGSKVRRTLNEFVNMNYVKEGMKEGNARSFYITSKGKEKLVEILDI